jgi:hypothetical protein
MIRKLTPLLAIVLTIVLAAPAAAQAEEIRRDVLNDIEATVSGVLAELSAIDQRVASDDWMVFESQGQGLVQVDLAGLGQWIPGVIALRRDAAGSLPADGLDSLAGTMPELWQASVLLADAPDRVLEAGAAATRDWLRDRFGHLQTPERKDALYGAERARLLDDLDALRQSREFFMTETLRTETAGTESAAQTETLEVEEWCREYALGETLMAEDGSVYLGPQIPPIDELPDWCRDALLARLTGVDGPIATPPPSDEVVALEPVRRSEDPLEWEGDEAIDHGRWDGVWEYWGYPGLTLVQVGGNVFGTYQAGDGWMKLAVVDEHTLIGHWYEGEHPAVCERERDGTVHWGSLQMRFNDDFTAYEGTFGDCDSLTDFAIDGGRAR